jgi:hypothetical protein
MFLFTAALALARDRRGNLLPKLQRGETLTYLIHYRSDKNIKTESSLVVPLAPTPLQTDVHGLLRIQVLDLLPAGGKLSVHARCQFLHEAEALGTKAAGENPNSEAKPLDPEGNPVEFTISPAGFAEKISGLDTLTPGQQQSWQEWLARFAMAWAIPAERTKIGDKWRIEEPEWAASPVAALTWARDSSYVRDEPCNPAQLSDTGEITPANGATDRCAVLLTNAKLVQRSSPKDATPPDFKLHQLKTTGTARGSNELISYISLATGLLVRATEEANQQMDVVVAKADGSNAVHYNVEAKSQLEVLLLTQAQASTRR